jgi:uncharacterized damage-inducible protein DinB
VHNEALNLSPRFARRRYASKSRAHDEAGRSTEGVLIRDELSDLKEHLGRYRAVTLQVLDVVNDEDLSWRPTSDQYSLGQQLIHIAQTEDVYSAGLFEGDWNWERARFPNPMPTLVELRKFFAEVRGRTLESLEGISVRDLGRVVPIPDSPVEASLRSWLWFILEHELHHKGQIWLYLRQMGYTAPFYAMPLPLCVRPDHRARKELGGF